MAKKIIDLNGKKIALYFNTNWQLLEKRVDRDHAILLIDENVFRHHPKKFTGWKFIICKSGENAKSLSILQSIVVQFLKLGANRTSTLIGIGGGAVTDLAGFIAGIYMRGIALGLVPTTLLAMTDAAVGGKNGINFKTYKNMLGLVRQPDFILFDPGFLQSLPNREWTNGFAEIIKHACIRDRNMFLQLEKSTPGDFQKNQTLLDKLIQKNVLLKMKIVLHDEREQHERKWLNFGHTLGHAIELDKKLSHGEAISIGMAAAAALSRKYLDFSEEARLIALLKKYHLPVYQKFNIQKIYSRIVKDKKSASGKIDFILLEKIGQAKICSLSLQQLLQDIQQIQEGKNF